MPPPSIFHCYCCTEQTSIEDTLDQSRQRFIYYLCDIWRSPFSVPVSCQFPSNFPTLCASAKEKFISLSRTVGKSKVKSVFYEDAYREGAYYMRKWREESSMKIRIQIFITNQPRERSLSRRERRCFRKRFGIA